ncbi:MAG: pyridoxamine 5'-phosphate oxidase family protein [Acidimicrobiales bacterium]
MHLDEAHARYLAGHDQGRLATVAPDGTPHNKPVGYCYNAELGSIDIAGFNMEASAKYRNIATNPDVAFVVDDAIGEGAAGIGSSRSAGSPSSHRLLHRARGAFSARTSSASIRGGS